MSDGAVVFDTRLNNKQLEKDYAKTVRKIEDLENEINIKSAKKSNLVKQADEMVGALDAAKARLHEMQNAGRGVFSSEQIQIQKENVAQLQNHWDGIQSKIEGYDRQIANATDKLDAQKEKAARITQEIETAEKAERDLGKQTENTAKRFDQLGKRFGQLALSALVFSVATKGLTMMRDWLGEVITKNDQTAAAIARLKGALLTLAQPLLTVIIPAFTALVNLLTAVIGKIAAFLSLLGGKTAKQSAKAAETLNKQSNALGGVAKNAKEARKQLMGFDELNILQDTTADASSGGGGMAEGIQPDFSWADGVSDTMEKIADWVLLIAGGLAMWKLSSYIPGTLGDIAGVLGKIMAGVGLVAVGFELLRDAFKDADENGMNLKNTLEMIAGIILTGLGITLLTGSLIPLLVAGILGILTAIVYMTDNGGYLIEGLKTTIQGLTDFVGGIFSRDWNRAWSGIVNIVAGACEIIGSFLKGIWDMIQTIVPWLSSFFGKTAFVGGEVVQMPRTYAAMPSMDIPYLAQGAVIPPNREFMAVLGDQAHGNNIEAPEDLIRKIVREEAGNSGKLEELMEILIATVEGIEVGDEVIGKAAARYTRSTSRARGT